MKCLCDPCCPGTRERCLFVTVPWEHSRVPPCLAQGGCRDPGRPDAPWVFLPSRNTQGKASLDRQEVNAVTFVEKNKSIPSKDMQPDERGSVC